MREPLTQMHDYGCAVACVAFATERTYRDVVDIMGEDYAKYRGFYCRDIKNYLIKLGMNYGHHHVKINSDTQIEDGAFIFIRRSKLYPAGHWLYKYNGLLMDPWINFPFSKDINKAKSGYRKRLPGKAQWIVKPLLISSF